MGTRTPRPMGPANPPWSGEGGVAVRCSPAVPGGGVGGGTWSKNPSFSSCMTKSTVLARTFGFDTRVSSTRWVKAMPTAGGAGGCSSTPLAAVTHDTCGSVPSATSLTKSSGNTGPNAFLYRDEDGSRARGLEPAAGRVVGLPRDPGRFELLGHGGPPQGELQPVPAVLED